MGEAGLFANERVELLDGEVVTMSPQDSRHAGTVNGIADVLRRSLSAAHHIRVQSPIVLDDRSEPEPDIAVCRADPAHYTGRHPAAGDVLLVLEVSGSSLAYDRSQKAVAYSRSGIPEYWIVNLQERTIEIRSDPDPAAARYLRVEVRAEGDGLRLPGGATVVSSELLLPL